jgi:hypothetical protein
LPAPSAVRTEDLDPGGGPRPAGRSEDVGNCRHRKGASICAPDELRRALAQGGRGRAGDPRGALDHAHARLSHHLSKSLRKNMGLAYTGMAYLYHRPIC